MEFKGNDTLAAVKEGRITSYNVCYTKLLRSVLEHFIYKLFVLLEPAMSDAMMIVATLDELRSARALLDRNNFV